ncbi:hypothetical protein SUS17_3548 [Sphingomonas sp. S17]|nr:hypothetical protein SUS17_3548 [Sphingomonas sp. S17]
MNAMSRLYPEAPAFASGHGNAYLRHINQGRPLWPRLFPS